MIGPRWVFPAVVAVLLGILGACGWERTYSDPLGDFSVSYPRGWEKTTEEAMAHWAKSGFDIPFVATRYLQEERNGDRVVEPVAWFVVRRGRIPIPGGGPDEDRLADWAESSTRSERGVTDVGAPRIVERDGVITAEVDASSRATRGVRRFYRAHGDVGLEVICEVPEKRPEEGYCRELFDGFRLGNR